MSQRKLKSFEIESDLDLYLKIIMINKMNNFQIMIFRKMRYNYHNSSHKNGCHLLQKNKIQLIIRFIKNHLIHVKNKNYQDHLLCYNSIIEFNIQTKLLIILMIMMKLEPGITLKPFRKKQLVIRKNIKLNMLLKKLKMIKIIQKTKKN